MLKPFYWLDFASVLPPLLLQVAPGNKVLDMCAAPGGKSLVLAQQLFLTSHSSTAGGSSDNCDRNAAFTESAGASSTSDNGSNASAADCGSGNGHHHHGALPIHQAGGIGQLVVNEMDGNRRERLSAIIKDYILHRFLPNIRVTGYDGTSYWNRAETEMYDRVLVDVPCSSDRHVVQQAAARGGALTRADWSVQQCQKLADTQVKVRRLGHELS